MSATAALGTALKIGANAIASLSSVGGISLSADTIDTTALDTTGGYRTFIAGFKDAGEVSMSGFFDPSDTTGQAALYAAFGTGAVTAFSIVFPSTMGASWAFDGVVTGFSTGASTSDAVTFDATIKVSGVPALTTTASADLTTLATNAGTIAPTYAGTTYAYYVDATNKTEYTVTATLTGAEILLYKNGVFVQELTSGSASATIAIAGIGTTHLITVMYKETAKSYKSYNLTVHKTS